MHRSALRIFLLAAVGIAIVVGAVAVPRASAYFLSDGCSEYDPARGITYVCNPSRTDFYTPDGVDPAAVGVGTGYPGESTSYTISRTSPKYVYCCDGGAIPPPAPFSPYKDYCSEPWFGWSPFAGIWQRACYNHDVCYGSQLGRKYCDTQFWRDMVSACKSHYAWYDPTRYACLFDARVWYQAVVWYGGSHYKPRTSSNQP